MDFAKFGNIANGGVIEGELAAIAKLQDGDGGHSLGDGGPVVGRCAVDFAMGICVGFAEDNGLGRALTAHEREASTDGAVLLERRFELRSEFVEWVLCGCRLRMDRCGDQKQQAGSNERGKWCTAERRHAAIIICADSGLCGFFRKGGVTASRKPQQDAGDGPAGADEFCFRTEVPPEHGAGGHAGKRNEHRHYL
jgi:hypothetical protein